MDGKFTVFHFCIMVKQGSKIAKGHQFQSIPFYSTKFIFKKVSQRRKKLKGGPFGIFLYPVCRKPKKIEGGPFGEFFFRKKSLAMPKKLKGGTLWSRPALYVMRETFWFCSLGQQMKFEIL